MADCTSPTLYPVVLSSIDGECVFAEYDLSSGLSSALINDTWSLVQYFSWACHSRLMDNIGDDPPTTLTQFGLTPNNTNPNSTTVVYISPYAAYGDWSANETSLNTCAEFNSLVGVTTPEATLQIESPVFKEGDMLSWRAPITTAEVVTIDSIDAFKITVGDVSSTGQTKWTSGGGGSARFNVKAVNNPGVTTASGGGSVGTSSLGELRNVDSTADSIAKGAVLITTTAGEWAPKGQAGALFPVNWNMQPEDPSLPTLQVAGMLTLNSQLNIGMGAGQTSAPFVVSDSGGNHVWYIGHDATLYTSGGIDVSGNKITQVGNPTDIDDAATKYYVDAMSSGVSGDYILKAGTVAFAGNQSMGSNKLTSVTNPTAVQDAATKYYVDWMTSGVSGDYILKAGTVAFTGDQSMGSNKLTSVTNPTAVQDAATKYYVDWMTSGVSGNYILKDGSVAFTGAQTGVSGTGATTLTTKAYVDTVASATSAVADIDHNSLDNLTTADPHTQYIYDAPTGGNRNQIVQSNASRDPFSIKAHASNNTNLTNWINSGDTTVAYIDKNFDFYTAGSVGAGTTVSGATVSGTTMEGLTVYAPSVSGDTVSGTTIKGITGTFGGTVTAASGTTDSVVPTNTFTFQRPFNHNAYRSATFGSDDTDLIYINTTDQDANFPIPANQTLKILAAYGRCKTGGTAGTTTWSVGIRAWDDQAHSSFDTFTCASNTTTATNTYLNVVGQGTMESPLASIDGGSYVAGMVFIKHENDGGGSSSNDKHTIDLYGVFV